MDWVVLLSIDLDEFVDDVISSVVGCVVWEVFYLDEILLYVVEKFDKYKFYVFFVMDNYGCIFGLFDCKIIEVVIDGKLVV